MASLRPMASPVGAVIRQAPPLPPERCLCASCEPEMTEDERSVVAAGWKRQHRARRDWLSDRGVSALDEIRARVTPNLIRTDDEDL